MEENRNLPMVSKNTLPTKLKNGAKKFGKILGSTLAFSASTIGLVASATMMPVLALPIGAMSLYTAQKLLNNTIYNSSKDLILITGKKGPNMKIYQDVVRPDILMLLNGIDDRQKLGFLQLQVLVSMAKYDSLGKDGKPVTFETDSHGIIRKTFQTLDELGYLQNYEERFLRESRIILPKLAFGNTKINKKVQLYNMKFQRTDEPINFEDPEFRKMFPAVFAKRGILAKQGYEIAKDENGKVTINYKAKKEKAVRGEEEKTESTVPRNKNLGEELDVHISPEQQAEFVRQFMQRENNQKIENDKMQEGISEQK